jgi:hypothetical protein
MLILDQEVPIVHINRCPFPTLPNETFQVAKKLVIFAYQGFSINLIRGIWLSDFTPDHQTKRYSSSSSCHAISFIIHCHIMQALLSIPSKHHPAAIRQGKHPERQIAMLQASHHNSSL